MERIIKQLSQDILFVKSWTPFDFKNVGQKAVKITYTSGEIDMLTTPMPPNIGSDKGNFKDETEYLQFITYLTKLNIPRG